MFAHSYQNPTLYSKSNSLQFDFAMKVIERAKIAKKARICDLGCGDGIITSKLAAMADEGCVFGADISDKMIAHANQTFKNQKNLFFIQMDSSENPLRNQFDIVTSFNSLHWVKNQAVALQGIANSLVEKGKAILLLSHKKSFYHFALDVTCAQPRWQAYFKEYKNPRSFFELGEYKALLKDAGLEVEDLVEREMIHHFNSIEKFKSFLASSMANVKQIPLDQQDDFLNDFCKEFFKQSNCNDLTNIPVGFWCLEVVANKPALIKECKMDKPSIFALP
jgi:ubiquinone/menaquinone biosynthesis C-methylase UbiE